MKGKRIVKGILYASAAAGGIFLTRTTGMTLEQWNAQDWFQLLRLAIEMNGAWVLVIVAYIDNPEQSKIPT